MPMFISGLFLRPMRLAVIAVVLLSGCAGNSSSRFAFWPGSQAKEPAEQPVLSPRQTADMQLAVGRTAEQQQQWQAAAAAYRQVLQTVPKHPEATHRLAVLYDRQGEFEQSDEWFQKALKLKPGDPDLFCDIGYSLSQQGRLREAEINLRQAIAITPEHYRAQNHLGVVLAQQGHQEQALAAFRRAQCSPAQAHANLALVYSLHQRPSEAQQHLEHAQRLAADDHETSERLQELEALLAQQRTQMPTPTAVANIRAASHSGEQPPGDAAGGVVRSAVSGGL